MGCLSVYLEPCLLSLIESLIALFGDEEEGSAQGAGP